VNCRQSGWPAAVDLLSPQRSLPFNENIYTWPDPARGVEWINPLAELRAMCLEPGDIQALLPYLADDDYILSYHVWRPWAHGWSTFQVNQLVEDLINEAAGEPFVDRDEFLGLPAERRPGYLAERTSAASSLHSRLVRAFTDGTAIRENPADPLVAPFALVLAVFYFLKRRHSRYYALLAGALLALAIVGLLYPGLQHQRVDLWLDAAPLVAITFYAAVSVWRGHTIGWPGVLFLFVLSSAAAYFIAFCIVDPALDYFFTLVTLVIFATVLLAPRESGKCWKCLLVICLLLSALLFLQWYPLHMFYKFGIGITAEHQETIDRSHFLITAGIVLVTIAIARFARLVAPPLVLFPITPGRLRRRGGRWF
jgi:hypothetical protein